MPKAKAPLKLVAFDAAKYLKDVHAIAECPSSNGLRQMG